MSTRDYYAEITPYFIADAHKLLGEARGALEPLLAGAQDKVPLDAAICALHALKGAAGLFKQEEIHLISGDLECLLEVGHSLRDADPAAFLALVTFVAKSLESIELLTRNVGGDPSTNTPIFSEFKQNITAAYGGYLESFRESEIVDTSQEGGGVPPIDPEILACFRDESREIFASIRECLGQLKESPRNQGALQKLARAFHTLKGSSALAGLTQVQEPAREQQFLLEETLEQGGFLTAEALENVEYIAARLHDLVQGDQPQAAAESPRDTAVEAPLDQELVNVFLEEAGAYLEEISRLIPELAGPGASAWTERLAKLFHTIKGSAGVVGLSEVSACAKEANDLLEGIRAGEAELPAGKTLGTYAAEKLAQIRAMLGVAAAPTANTAEAPVQEPQVAQSAKDVRGEDLEFFILDARENLDLFTQSALAFEKQSSDSENLDAMLRAMHTVKGASSLVGADTIVRMAGALEDLLENVAREGCPEALRAELVELLLGGADSVQRVLEQLSSGSVVQGAPETELARKVKSIRSRIRAGGRVVTLSAPVPDFSAAVAQEPVQERRPVEKAPEKAKPQPRPVEREKPVAEPAATDTSETESRKERQTIRVDAERLNRLMNLVGELISSRTRLANKIDRLSGVREELSARKDRLLELVNDFQLKYEFGHTVNRLENRLSGRIANGLNSDSSWQFSDLEFDQYDDFNILSRSLIEITSDVSEIMSQLDQFFHDLGEEAGVVGKVSSNMQYEVTQIRMVPAQTLFDRLSRPLRDAAKKEGKKVELTCVGSDTELDKAIIDDLFKPFLHLVRNAVSHGIEAPQLRKERSKPESGTVLLRAFHEGNNVVVEVQDDGGGIDFEAVRRKGVELGFLRQGDTPGEDELINLLFRAGFSTRSQVSDVSGRGVGMDVVADVVRRLNGSVSVHSVPGTGTKISVRLPLTLAINQALIVAVQEQAFAIPLNFVEEAILMQPREIDRVAGSEAIRVRGVVIPVVRLAQLFGESDLKDHSGKAFTAVIVAVENRRVALIVDRVVQRQEIVVKSAGDFLRPLSHIAGGTTGGDGNVYFIVDVPVLVGQQVRATSGAESAAADISAPGEAQPRRRNSETKRVLVVDDSISVRKVASKLLKNAGFDVELAVDGLQGLELLRTGDFDVVMTDLEMPQMNGYELISEVRRLETIRHLPIVVVTSRTGQKHVEKAFSLGADAYLGKPFTQDDLVSSLEKAVVARQAAPV